MDKISLESAMNTEFWKAVGVVEPSREITVKMTYGELMAIRILIERYQKGQFRKMYGFDYAHRCGDCKHMTYTERNRRWYKCRLMGISASAATDIRLSDPACKRWEKEE